MTETLVATNFNLATNVSLDLTAEITFDLVVFVDVVLQLDEIIFSQILDAGVRVNAGSGEDSWARVRPMPKM